MKTLIIILSLCIACPAVAENWNEQEMRIKSAKAAMRKACPPKNQETWKDQEKRAACEEKFKLDYYDSSPSDNNSPSGTSSAPIERGLSINGVPATSVGGGNYIDNSTGHFLQGAAGGVIDTKTGQFIPTY